MKTGGAAVCLASTFLRDGILLTEAASAVTRTVASRSQCSEPPRLSFYIPVKCCLLGSLVVVSLTTICTVRVVITVTIVMLLKHLSLTARTIFTTMCVYDYRFSRQS